MQGGRFVGVAEGGCCWVRCVGGGGGEEVCEEVHLGEGEGGGAGSDAEGSGGGGLGRGVGCGWWSSHCECRYGRVGGLVYGNWEYEKKSTGDVL